MIEKFTTFFAKWIRICLYGNTKNNLQEANPASSDVHVKNVDTAVVRPSATPSSQVAPSSEKDAPTKGIASPKFNAEVNKQIKDYLFNRYEFRYNLLTEQVEYRNQGDKSGDFEMISRRKQNTMVINVLNQGLYCWDKDVERILKSDLVDNYHPFYDYMQRLPEWDGKDRIRALSLRVSDDPVWMDGFRRWLLAMTAQWMGKESRCANTLTPILISTKQGMSKSSFCRLLMPPALKNYYLDKFDLNAKANAEVKLGQFGLINLDEFDRYSNSAMATLKNLLQLKELSVKKAYSSYFQQLGRIASFIGTSNQMELLNDPTGSRRFLCVEVKHPIDCSPIDHDQLFAQLKWLVLQGERIWMDQEEEQKLQEHNLYFKRMRPEEEVFHSLFQIPNENEHGKLLCAAEIHRCLCQSNPSAMRGVNVIKLGRSLSTMGLKRVRTKTGNKYEVIVKTER